MSSFLKAVTREVKINTLIRPYPNIEPILLSYDFKHCLDKYRFTGMPRHEIARQLTYECPKQLLPVFSRRPAGR